MIKGLLRLRTLARAGIAAARLGAVAVAASAAPAFAQLNVICPVQAEWCNLAATEFERETGIKVAMTLKGSGESLAQIAVSLGVPERRVIQLHTKGLTRLRAICPPMERAG